MTFLLLAIVRVRMRMFVYAVSQVETTKSNKRQLNLAKYIGWMVYVANFFPFSPHSLTLCLWIYLCRKLVKPVSQPWYSSRPFLLPRSGFYCFICVCGSFCLDVMWVLQWNESDQKLTLSFSLSFCCMWYAHCSL